jgi:prepilin-type N-terminal cleavage/methylation domain-containing protein
MKKQGFTLVEMLIALGILGIVLGMASSAIVQYLGIQSDQEATTSAQARLRRTTELVSQELRSAILGAVTNQPYTSNNQQLSVALLDGSAGYPATTLTGTTTQFISTATTATLGLAANNLVLIVGSNGLAALRTVTTVSNPSTNTWQLTHAACTLPVLNDPLLFKVKTLGYRRNTANNQLVSTEAGVESAVAFNITGFNVDYIYTAGGASQVNPVGFPARSVVVGGSTFTLDRLQVTMTAQELSRGKTITRTYSNQIDLADASRFAQAVDAGRAYSIQGVTVCP